MSSLSCHWCSSRSCPLGPVCQHLSLSLVESKRRSPGRNFLLAVGGNQLRVYNSAAIANFMFTRLRNRGVESIALSLLFKNFADNHALQTWTLSTGTVLTIQQIM